MGNEHLQFLEDIRSACENLSEFTRGKTLSDYLESALLRSACERQFEIVGEALNRLLRADPTFASKITDWKRIIDFRNRLVHGYASIDDEVVWGVIEGSLDKLQSEVVQLLNDESR